MFGLAAPQPIRSDNASKYLLVWLAFTHLVYINSNGLVEYLSSISLQEGANITKHDSEDKPGRSI